jgi:hypothetical protein
MRGKFAVQDDQALVADMLMAFVEALNHFLSVQVDGGLQPNKETQKLTQILE